MILAGSGQRIYYNVFQVVVSPLHVKLWDFLTVLMYHASMNSLNYG